MMLRLGRTALAVLALTPVAGYAHSPDTAVDACIQAFLSTDIAKGRQVTVRTPQDYVPRPLALSGRYQVEVVAKGRESGKRVARLVCDVNARGMIVAINGRPAAAVPSFAAAR